jgi:hypothetical protein
MLIGEVKAMNDREKLIELMGGVPHFVREKRYCEVCGVHLRMDYYYIGYCPKHCRQTFIDANGEISRIAAEAVAAGMSYGRYVAMKCP